MIKKLSMKKLNEIMKEVESCKKYRSTHFEDRAVEGVVITFSNNIIIIRPIGCLPVTFNRYSKSLFEELKETNFKTGNRARVKINLESEER